MRRGLFGLAATTAVILALAPPVSAARETVILATVGPGPNMIVETLDHKPVRRLKPGRYYFVVRDRSIIRNFHLKGPGIDRKTPVAAVHAFAWHVRLRKGVYTYGSDPQGRAMRGTFRVA